MTLKDTITKWHGATCLLEQNHLKEAMQCLMQIQNPSAKIVYNLGCISMKMDLYTDAIEYFTACLEQDKYLAIAYFQRGVCFYKIRSHSSAERDFEAAKAMIPSEGIDYRQLGAKLILHAKMIEGFSRSCRHHAETNMPSPVQTSFMDFVFYPPKKMVANLKKEDFLGKAKVISSVQESDILYAESKSLKDNAPKKNAMSGVKSTLSASMLQLSSASKSLPSASGKTALPPSRPPPRLGRSQSLGDLLDSGIDTDGTDSSSSGASSLTVPPVSADHHLQNKRQSTGDYDYSHVTQDYGDSFSSYTRLSVSSPIIDQNPIGKKPVVPKRPVAPPRGNREKDNTFSNNNNDSNNNHNIHIKSSLSTQPRLEFQKIHEALKGKFSEDASNHQYQQQQAATINRLKPIKVNYGSKSQEELNNMVPPKRVLAQSHPNLSRPMPTPKQNPSILPTQSQKVPSVQLPITAGKPNRPPVPAPRKSPDRTLDTDKPTRPPRPPPPRKC